MPLHALNDNYPRSIITSMTGPVHGPRPFNPTRYAFNIVPLLSRTDQFIIPVNGETSATTLVTGMVPPEDDNVHAFSFEHTTVALCGETEFRQHYDARTSPVYIVEPEVLDAEAMKERFPDALPGTVIFKSRGGEYFQKCSSTCAWSKGDAIPHLTDIRPIEVVEGAPETFIEHLVTTLEGTCISHGGDFDSLQYRDTPVTISRQLMARVILNGQTYEAPLEPRIIGHVDPRIYTRQDVARHLNDDHLLQWMDEVGASHALQERLHGEFYPITPTRIPIHAWGTPIYYPKTQQTLWRDHSIVAVRDTYALGFKTVLAAAGLKTDCEPAPYVEAFLPSRISISELTERRRKRIGVSFYPPIVAPTLDSDVALETTSDGATDLHWLDTIDKVMPENYPDLGPVSTLIHRLFRIESEEMHHRAALAIYQMERSFYIYVLQTLPVVPTPSPLNVILGNIA